MRFDNITVNDVDSVALKHTLQDVLPENNARKYTVRINNVDWPVKFIIQKAYELVYAKPIKITEFTSLEARNYLIKLGKAIETIGDEADKEYNIPFFTKKEFELLGEVGGQEKNSSARHDQVYKELSLTYKKIEFWAQKVVEQIFPEGGLDIRKKPTNQANRFSEYLWAKIYPDKKSKEKKILAYTVTISSDMNFVVKIDTVGLNDSDDLKKKYLNYRGENYYYSNIVKVFSSQEFLEYGWDNLIEATLNAIEELKPDFENLYKIIYNENYSMDKNITSNNPTPLNQILFGPPGTGKTYETIRLAATIASGQKFSDSDEDYEKAKKKFSELLHSQIEFITFHQNYSYEDFVYGIKPNVLSDVLAFKEVEGKFYRINKEAIDNYLSSTNSGQEREPDYDEVFEYFIQPLELEDQEIEIQMASKGYSFHLTALNEKNLSFRKKSGGTGHTLSLKTLKELYEGDRAYSDQGLGVYYRPLVSAIRQRAISLRKRGNVTPLKNYVLIIDEINRANISRVFGELITLIEEDKRLGKLHHIELQLPGLTKPFSVAPNLYIIGTMNTADKSIALIDIALRRRFDFVPKYPISAKIKQIWKEFFVSLNKQIRETKGSDFLIGHYYFMESKENPKSFSQILNQKIIPLLNEYFYSTKNKVKEILNKALIDGNLLNNFDILEDENNFLFVKEKPSGAN